jgi:hypothetical protein
LTIPDSGSQRGGVTAVLGRFLLELLCGGKEGKNSAQIAKHLLGTEFVLLWILDLTTLIDYNILYSNREDEKMGEALIF